MYGFYFYHLPHSLIHSASSVLLVPSWLTLQTAAAIVPGPLTSRWVQPMGNASKRTCLGYLFPDPSLLEYHKLPSSVTPALSEHQEYCFPTCFFSLMGVNGFFCCWFLSACHSLFPAPCPHLRQGSFIKCRLKNLGNILFCFENLVYTVRVIDKLKDYKHLGYRKQPNLSLNLVVFYFFFLGQNHSSGISANPYF